MCGQVCDLKEIPTTVRRISLQGLGSSSKIINNFQIRGDKGLC